jgi:hypothetical protein
VTARLPFPPPPTRRERWRWRVVRHVPQSILLHPFELYLAGVCVLSGVPLLIGEPAPTSIEALLPPLLVRLWGFELLLGAGLVLFGLLRPRSRLERVGHTLLAPAAVVYGAAIVTVVGVPGVLAGTLVAGFGLASATRGYVLRVAEDVLMALVLEQREESGGPDP